MRMRMGADSGGEGTRWAVDPQVLSAVDDWMDQEDDGAFESTVREYRHSVFRKLLLIAVCSVVIVAVAGVAVAVGAYDISFLDSYGIILDHILGHPQDVTRDHIVVDLRTPRILAGILAGAGFAVCGVVMQSILKNPLADPYTTGVSSGASFGATLAMTSGAVLLFGQWAVVSYSFALSLIPTAVIILVSKLKNASPATMIMAGIGVMYIFNALTTVLMLWANPQDLARIFQWQVGTLANITWPSVPIIAAVVLPGVVAVQILSNKLNVLATGDDTAKSMGVDADRTRVLCLVLVGLISAAIVSFTGLIGFVGLVTPHIVRMFIGADNRFLAPASAIFGGMLLLLADLLSRIAMGGSVLPVGVVMAFIGGPLFIWLILNKNTKAWG